VVHELNRADRMLERIDLAYALNVHTAGVTTDHGIVMMSAREGALASQSTFLVAVTRIADKALIAAAIWNAGCCAIPARRRRLLRSLTIRRARNLRWMGHREPVTGI
jgi:hypothetical protein